jgi:hypothetical protein
MRLTPLAVAALFLLAACGSDSGGAVVSDAPPSSTTSTTTSPPERCSVNGVRLVLEEQDLPSPVAEKRQAIFDAAVACDFDALADEAGDQFNYTFGDPGAEPAAYWRQQEREGHPVMLPLARVLNLPSVERHELEGTPYRTWPSANQEHRTQADWDALRGFYSPEEVAQFQRFDMYTGWRTAITDAGAWMYFVAGD